MPWALHLKASRNRNEMEFLTWQKALKFFRAFLLFANNEPKMIDTCNYGKLVYSYFNDSTGLVRAVFNE
jgi:hypothetical protein